MTANYFCVRNKDKRKHNQHLKLLFFKISLAHQTKYLHMEN